MDKKKSSRPSKTAQEQSFDDIPDATTDFPQYAIPQDSQQDKIQRLYRIRHKGKQYLYYVVDKLGVKIGISKHYTYRKYKEYEEREGGVMVPVEKEDPTMIVKTELRYDIPFTKETALDLVENCKNSSDDPKFRFVNGVQVVAINDPDNFVADFDEVMKKARKGEVV